jgi:hypothetical protein
MSLTLDFKGQKYPEFSNTFTVLPVGNYQIVIQDILTRESKDGAFRVAIKMKIVRGEYKGTFIEKSFFIYDQDEVNRKRNIHNLTCFAEDFGNVDCINEENKHLFINKYGTIKITKNADGTKNYYNEMTAEREII